MKLAVVGSRSFQYDFNAKVGAIYLICDKIEELKIDHLVSGGAKGPDHWGEEAAGNYHLSTTIYKPNWNKHGKAAGFIRNELIIDAADHVLLFWDGKSRGTKHDLDLARKKGKNYELFVWEKENWTLK